MKKDCPNCNTRLKKKGDKIYIRVEDYEPYIYSKVVCRFCFKGL